MRSGIEDERPNAPPNVKKRKGKEMVMNCYKYLWNRN